MGGTNSSTTKEDNLRYENLISNYNLLRKIKDIRYGNITILEDKQTKELVALKEMVSRSTIEFNKEMNNLKICSKITHPNILKLYGYTYKAEDNLCASIYKFLLIIEYLEQDLEREIKQKKMKDQYYTEDQLWYIAETLVSGLALLQLNNIVHGDIKPENILISKKGIYKIAEHNTLDGTLMPGYHQRLSGFNDAKCYLSPLLVKSLQRQELKPKHNPYKSDVFSLGMVLLHAASLQSCDKFYKWESFSIDQKEIEQRISSLTLKFYSESFLNLLKDMLNFYEEARPDFIELDGKIKESTKHINNIDDMDERQSERITHASLNERERESESKPKNENTMRFKDIAQESYFNHNNSVEVHNLPERPKKHIAMSVMNENKPPAKGFDDLMNYQNTTQANKNIPPLSNQNIPIQQNLDLLSKPNRHKSNNGALNPRESIKNASPFRQVHQQQGANFGFRNSAVESQEFNNEQYHKPCEEVAKIMVDYSKPQIDSQTLKNPSHNIGNTNAPLATINCPKYPLSSHNNSNAGTGMANIIDFNQTINQYQMNEEMTRILREFKSTDLFFNSNLNGPSSSSLPIHQEQPFKQQNTTNYPIQNSLGQFTNPNPIIMHNNDQNQFYLTKNNYPLQSDELQVNQPHHALYNPYQMVNSNPNPYLRNDYGIPLNSLNPTEAYAPVYPENTVSQPVSLFSNQLYNPSSNLITVGAGTGADLAFQGIKNNKQIGAINQINIPGNAIPNAMIQIVTEHYIDGSIYEGEKLNGQRHGKGKFFYSDGGMYEGEWKNGFMDGFGTLFYAGGNIAYHGSWKEDKFSGKGVVYNENPIIPEANYFDYTNFDNLGDFWIKFEGDFINDNKDGFGTLWITNGDKYQGQFKEDMIHGKGVYYFANGQKINGEWRNNILTATNTVTPTIH